MDETNQFVALQEHLVLCEECFVLYQGLRLMEQLVINDALPTPPRKAYRKPDLSFLQPMFEWVKIRTQATGEKMMRTLRLHLSVLFQQVQLVPSFVRSDDSGVSEMTKVDDDARQEGLSLGVETLGELDVEVKLYPEPDDITLACLEVHAIAIERFAVGFSGTLVLLRLAGKEEIVRETNEEGVAIFTGLLRDELPTAILEITPAGEL
jgi:hypothetical protein